MLSDNNVAAKDSELATVVINSGVKLSEEEAVEFLGNHNLVIAYTLLDSKDFIMSPQNISQRLNVSKVEAENIINILLNMGMLESTCQQDVYKTTPLCFDDAFMSSSDLLSLFTKFSQASLAKMTSKDVFAFRFEMLSKKVIQKYHLEIQDLIEKMTKESIGHTDCEVYSSLFSFTKVTRTRKEK